MVTAAGNGGMDGLNAHLVFKLKYEGNGTVRLVLRLRNLQNCQLLEGEEVDTWFNRLETIIGHLGNLKEDVTDCRRLAHCLDALQGHEMLVTVLESMLAEGKLTYDVLKTQARVYFNRRETTRSPRRLYRLMRDPANSATSSAMIGTSAHSRRASKQLVVAVVLRRASSSARSAATARSSVTMAQSVANASLVSLRLAPTRAPV